MIFADGQSHDPGEMLKEAELLKKMGVNILSVGYGVNVTKKIEGMKNLRTMATNHKDVFSIDFKNNDLVLEEKIEVIAKHLVQVDCPRAFARMFIAVYFHDHTLLEMQNVNMTAAQSHIGANLGLNFNSLFHSFCICTYTFISKLQKPKILLI